MDDHDRRRLLRPHIAFIGIGSNRDAERQVERAIDRLARHVKVQGISTIYRTPAARGQNIGWFCNAVVAIQTRMPARCLSPRLLKPIERDMGRHAFTADQNTVPIDLDLLVTTPMDAPRRGAHCHPTVRMQAYAALPLLEIAGDLRLDDDETLTQIVARLDSHGLYPLPALTERIRRRHHLPAEAPA